MDMELDLIEECYATFNQFSIDVPKEDSDMVYGLRYAFQNMLLTVCVTNFLPFAETHSFLYCFSILSLILPYLMLFFLLTDK